MDLDVDTGFVMLQGHSFIRARLFDAIVSSTITCIADKVASEVDSQRDQFFGELEFSHWSPPTSAFPIPAADSAVRVLERVREVIMQDNIVLFVVDPHCH